MLKRTLILTALSTCLIITVTPTLASGGAQDAPQPITVRGQIWDSTCAAAGSHGKLMNKMKAKDAKECTLECVKAGAQFVLYNTDDKTVYRLDSQEMMKQYAGQTVTVIGSYDRATGTIRVDRVETEP